jgi:hypothetical protein
MKKILLVLFAVTTCIGLGHAQCTECHNGRGPINHSHNRHAKGDGGLSQSYILQNVCGLNYVQATMLTETRTQTISTNMNGKGFPANLSLSGLPSLICASVQKAYLYYGCTYTETTPPATTATITNPALSTSTLPAVMVGTTLDDICWPGPGSATYRVDVTSLISGNGIYNVNLNGFANAANEVDGITLIVIYTDPSAGYSGSIALYDGDLSTDGGLSIDTTLTSFSVCNSTSNATAFTLMGDVQGDVCGGINTETYNGSTATFTNDFWNYCAIPTSLTAGQTSAYFQTYTNNTGDCYFIGLAGLYWQNTTCTTCVPTVTTMTLTTASAATTCGSNGAASVNVTGAVGPLTYDWNPGGQTTDTVTGLSAGTYTVNVSDGSTCAMDTITVANHGMMCTTSSTAANCVSNGTATVSATGGTGPYTYSWSTGATTSSISAAANTYSYSVSDNTGCTLTGSVTITNGGSVSIYAFANPGYTCPYTAGSANVSVYSGKPPFTYSWSPGGQTTDSVSGLSAGTYSVTVKDSNGCTATDTVAVFFYSNHLSTSSYTSSYICAAAPGSASIGASGGVAPYTYLWSPGGQTTAAITGLSAGNYTVTITDSLGCDTTTIINVGIGSVSMYASASSYSISAGDSTLLSAYANVPGGKFYWTPAASISYPDSNSTYAHPTTNTTYYVVDSTPCGPVYDSVTITMACPNNFDEPICIVTVDTATNKSEVIWGRTNSPPSGSYNVYKYDTNFLYFALIDNQSIHALSEYIDSSSNPSAGVSTYELSTVDSCGESALSSPHSSIYLTFTPGVNINTLNWTAYVGFTPMSYQIYRGLSMNSMVFLDSVSGTTLSYVDSLPPAGSIYLVEAESPYGVCVPTTHKKTGPSETHAMSMSNAGVKKVLGVNNLGIVPDNLKVYPNPGNGRFTLSYSVNGSGNVKMMMTNMLGQIVYSEQKYVAKGTINEQLNLSNLANGIYSLRIETGYGMSTIKVAVIK